MKINQLYEKRLLQSFCIPLFFIIIWWTNSFFYFSRKKIVQKELEKRDLEIKHQREQLRAIIITQETERKRIAQDLHDDISSKLNVFK
jgi:signal transduction histidine kinase